MSRNVDRQTLLRDAVRLRRAIEERGRSVPPAPARSQIAKAAAPCASSFAGPGLPSLSVMFFSAEQGEAGDDPYALVLAAARAADQAGFEAVWLPERHFERFGGPYPNPAVLAAAVARETTRIRVRSGSVVLPLHDPIEVVEAWSMVDHLSGGRVDFGFASGWNPNDFVLAPDALGEARTGLERQIGEVVTLWRGGGGARINGKGETVTVTPHPRPVQDLPGIWVATTGNPETLEMAGRAGFNILTMVLGGTLEDIGERARIYRAARAAAGHDPSGGHVTLMLHTYVDPDHARAMDRVRGPMTSYVRDALEVHAAATGAGAAFDAGEKGQMADYAFQRYLRAASLIGTPEDCRETLRATARLGVDEIACLLDFGMPADHVLEGLDPLATLAVTGVSGRPSPTPQPRAATTGGSQKPVAIIGAACRFPGASGLEAFRRLLASGATALAPPPPGRSSLARGGFLEDIDRFDPEPFRLAPAEAALMDPHQRLFLETVRHALADAGIAVEAARGRRIGVFAAMYSTSYLASGNGGSDDPLAVAGGLSSMVANRTSFVFDWRGPSETINTACSSGLVAVHRACQSLRAGECEIAIAGGVSLLLSDRESSRLADLGILAEDGLCRAFDQAARGQVRGEGIGIVVLRTLDGVDPGLPGPRAVIRGSAIGHAGGTAGSVTLPSSTSQAEVIAAAWRDAGIKPARQGYIEAHGAGTRHGDLSEVAALKTAFRSLCLDADDADWTVGSVKPVIGSLDAAGGLAGLIAASLALEDGMRPGNPGLSVPAEDLSLESSPLSLARVRQPWPPALNGVARQAGVHAYGLGGVSAHVVLEQAPRTRKDTSPPPPASIKGSGAKSAEAPAPVVADFYDYVAHSAEGGEARAYLTLAPLPEIVPGFSWSRTMQDPAAHPGHAALMRNAQSTMRAVLLDGVDWSRIGRVLDFGCGFATDLIELAEQHSDLLAVGYTISPTQAEAARRCVSRAGLDARIEIHCRDSAADPFPGQFQLAIGYEVGHHVKDKDGLFGNLANHVESGGTLALIDCAADTVAPIDLPEVGSHTSTLTDYADILAVHGFRIRDCVDASREVANFLVDPGLDQMLENERSRGDRGDTALLERVQRSWDGFGAALAEGLIRYLLIVAERRDAPNNQAHNRRWMGVS